MKKVRMIVSAAVVFAAVSGALAFRTSNFNSGNISCLSSGTGTCPSTNDYQTSSSGTAFLHCGAAGSDDCNGAGTTQVNVVGN